MSPRPRIPFLPLFALLSILSAASASADPTLGFTEEFPGNSFGNWVSPWPLGNPTTGGVGGNDDGYLFVPATDGFLGVRTGASEYVGNYLNTGVTEIRLWVRDISGLGDLELHFGFGNQGNFWQHNAGVVPLADRWSPYVVDLTNQADFTQIIGTDSFQDALSNVDRVLLRHDVAPYEQTPDRITATLGLDHILLTNGTVGVDRTGAPMASIRLGVPHPNPVRSEVTFALESKVGEFVTLRVLDLSGRQLLRTTLAGGAIREWTWDGRDEAGHRARPGVYLVQAIGASGHSERRVALVR